MTETERLIAKDLLGIKAVFFRPDEPFTWASGIKSPVYCDNRLTLTAPAVRNDVENGLAELTYRNDVQDAANIRANEIISTFSHTRPDGSSCFTAVTVNYYAIGENIASGQKNAEEVMNTWMNSPGHRANILSAQFTGMVVGVVQYQGVSYWVQIFIG